MINGSYNPYPSTSYYSMYQAPLFNPLEQNSGQTVNPISATQAPVNSSSAEIIKYQQKIQKLEKDKKYSNFYITGMAIASIVGAIGTYLASKTKEIKI